MMKSTLGLATLAACLIAAQPVRARAQAPGPLAPVDYTFIGLTYLGNQFQVDTGRLAKTQATDPAVRKYAALMDTSHVEVEDKLVALLHRMNVTQPPASLLAGAYQSLLALLSAEHGPAFEQDYVKTQLGYQNANDALYRWEIQNGSSAELKDFARQVLPKIDDHRQQVMALSSAAR